MARVTVEDCLTKVQNRFALVLLVSKRAKQLMKGSQATLSAKSNKNVVVSLREVAGGNVYFDVDETMGNPETQIVNDLNR
ncbi:MAG: DNA-directed RNA polymerase subunit omega [Bdellovibrionaceae bacterium]|nr:DNA-directed RNA polymerase subunit omega [Bdellovibrionales bacterium]MCB9082889.1 DNA-directed RNA polymerase subunit omega [Pseudobdellovibrionaceae bacterium]